MFWDWVIGCKMGKSLDVIHILYIINIKSVNIYLIPILCQDMVFPVACMNVRVGP